MNPPASIAQPSFRTEQADFLLLFDAPATARHFERSKPTFSCCLTPQLPPVISNGASRRFFFPARSREPVGLRREKSLFAFAFVATAWTLPRPRRRGGLICWDLHKKRHDSFRRPLPPPSRT